MPRSCWVTRADRLGQVSDLRIDERTVRQKTCPRCGRSFEHVTGFVMEADGAHSVYFAACHGHPEHEAQIDVVLGTWTSDDATDHVTFSSILRRDGAMAVDATVAVGGTAPFFGRKLSREEALAHPWVATFWQVVDLLATGDPAVKEHVATG